MENSNSLAKLSLGINLVLVIAVIFLFVKMPSGGSEEVAADDTTNTKVNFSDNEPIRVAYFDNDSLNINAQFMVDVQQDIQQVSIDAQGKIQRKEQEIINWQKKWNDKGQLLPREMEQAQKEQMELEQEYAQLQQQVQMDAQMQTESLMSTMFTRIAKYGESFCKENNIDLLLAYSRGGGVIYASKKLDVTKEFTNHMNKEYLGASDKEGKEEKEGDKKVEADH
ncbi:OmpH family outer membrane protein [Paracrocinitomix mangrovi]|uniref:OmpH family outer membrane protein n=1 Tax=Paracrocinitomix mangrovi TaxID=2862509 RepID=UPI001C8DC293|nr:OmpH family outer membrane protein [Paracrocinitomix mangrovi]UKN02612.1 OmpH family outer membrane protein [Paracrocinitomix mangrovi]